MELLIQKHHGGVQEFAFLTNVHVMLMLLVPGPFAGTTGLCIWYPNHFGLNIFRGPLYLSTPNKSHLVEIFVIVTKPYSSIPPTNLVFTKTRAKSY